MTGTLVRLYDDKNFGFISSGGKDYFFHRDSYKGDWNDLIMAHSYAGENLIELEFDIVDNPKGPRAENVRNE